jgi:chorismate mutase/prephenate dehydratase
MAPEIDDIEGIDHKIIELISKRSDVYVNAFKKRPADKGLFLSEDRSRIFRLIEEANRGPLANRVLEKIYTEIMSGSAAAVAVTKVAFLGPDGSFAYAAVNEFFGDSILPLPQKTIQDVFLQVETGKAQFGVVPVENSTEGSVTYTLDELTETNLYIQAEKYMRVSYNLMSKSKDIGPVRKIYAHPQTLGQCKGWLRANLPDAALIGVESTSRSAELAAEEAGAPPVFII